MTAFVDLRMGRPSELPVQSNVPNDCHKDDLGPLSEGWESGKTLKCFPILDFTFLNLAFIEKVHSLGFIMNIIPLHLLELFREVSAKNRSQDGRHVETLAYLFGYKDDQNHIATHLIFPEQESTCSRVDDKGMFSFKYLLTLYGSIHI